jgi:parvulin-like peptidyl-prolyl isomerase
MCLLLGACQQSGPANLSTDSHHASPREPHNSSAGSARTGPAAPQTRSASDTADNGRGFPAASGRTATAPPSGSLQGDIVMVNDRVISVAEALFALRHEIEAARRTQTKAGFREQVERLARRYVQQEIGALLVYEKAVAGLTAQQTEQLDKLAQEELGRIVARDYGGASARLWQELARCGLTMDQLRDSLKRQLIVRQYARDVLLPRSSVRRDEMLSYYRDNQARYRTAELRELLLIAAPFERFLPDGQTWEAASPAARSQARLAAVRHIREAHSALATRPFDQVAQEYSREPQAASGGSWGLIGRPLQPPYDELSQLIFGYQEEQVSEPIETPRGWYIVKCGRIQPARRTPFTEAQEEIRRTLEDRKFNQALSDYVYRLAEKATISSTDAFVREVLRRAESGWPSGHASE